MDCMEVVFCTDNHLAIIVQEDLCEQVYVANAVMIPGIQYKGRWGMKDSLWLKLRERV